MIDEKTIESLFEKWKEQNLTIVEGEIKVMAKTMSGVRNVGVSMDTFEDCFRAAIAAIREGRRE